MAKVIGFLTSIGSSIVQGSNDKGAFPLRIIPAIPCKEAIDIYRIGQGLVRLSQKNWVRF